MSEIKFSKNYSDHSVSAGANAGFQFEFNCERCGDAWRTEFVPYRGGQASSWLGKAAVMKYVCDPCWNRDKGLCRACAPDAQVEIEAARASGEVYAAGEKAALEGIQRGKQMDVKRDRQLVCPKCNAETHGAKFCPECGFKLAAQSECPKCAAEVSPGAKFCPECGEKLG